MHSVKQQPYLGPSCKQVGGEVGGTLLTPEMELDKEQGIQAELDPSVSMALIMLGDIRSWEAKEIFNFYTQLSHNQQNINLSSDAEDTPFEKKCKVNIVGSNLLLLMSLGGATCAYCMIQSIRQPTNPQPPAKWGLLKLAVMVS